MDPEEIKKLTDLTKLAKEMADLRKTLEIMKEAQKQQVAIRKFLRENRERLKQIRENPSGAELEKIREEAGYDKEVWAAIVRELLGEPPLK